MTTGGQWGGDRLTPGPRDEPLRGLPPCLLAREHAVARNLAQEPVLQSVFELVTSLRDTELGAKPQTSRMCHLVEVEPARFEDARSLRDEVLEREIPLGITNLIDHHVAAHEGRPNAEHGCRSLVFTECPRLIGLPPLHSGQSRELCLL